MERRASIEVFFSLKKCLLKFNKNNLFKNLDKVFLLGYVYISISALGSVALSFFFLSMLSGLLTLNKF